MVYKKAVLVIGLTASLFVPSAARADDIQDLKVAFKQALGAINSRDTDTLPALMDDGIVSFTPELPLPAVGKEVNRRVWRNILENNQNVILTQPSL